MYMGWSYWSDQDIVVHGGKISEEAARAIIETVAHCDPALGAFLGRRYRP